MFRVVHPPIIRSAYNCNYSICYLSHRYCYHALRSRGVVGGELELLCRSNSVTRAAGSSNGVINTNCWRYSLCSLDDGWRYHPKHVEQFNLKKHGVCVCVDWITSYSV
jgi:hypothetical protein